MLQFTSSNAFKGKSPLGINNVSLKNGLDKNSVNGTPKKKLVIKTLKGMLANAAHCSSKFQLHQHYPKTLRLHHGPNFKLQSGPFMQVSQYQTV